MRKIINFVGRFIDEKNDIDVLSLYLIEQKKKKKIENIILY